MKTFELASRLFCLFQILNKSSWERGFAHGSVYKTEFIDLSQKVKSNEDNLVFGIKPEDERVMGKLDEDGLPPVGAILKFGDPFYSYVNQSTGENFIMYYK